MVTERLLVGGTLATLLLAAAPPAAADSVRDGQWYLGPLGIDRAHTVTRGAGVKVGIVDSGVDGSIPDLAGAVVAGRDFSGTGGAHGGPVSGNPHGTRGASLLVGRGHGTGHGSGVLGAAPAAGLVVAAIDTPGDPQTQIPPAVRWIVDRGAKVINFSLIGAGSKEETAAYRYAEARDVVLVASSGNNAADQLDVPCSLPGVVCVGGIDKDLRHDSTANTGSRLSVVGPYATRDPHGATPGPRDGLPVAEPASAATRYSGVRGTSSSAPIVAGIIALIRAKYPSMDAANVINRLIRTARPVGASPNRTYGYGIPDAYRALTASVPTVGSNPLGTLVTTTPVTTTPRPGSASVSPTTAPTTAPVAVRPESGGPNAGLLAGVAAAVVVVLAAATMAIRRRRPKT